MGRVRNQKDYVPVIAFCGTRGLPANYGGFETAVDEISKKFVEKGYKCDVFTRKSSSNSTVNEIDGRNIIYVKGSHHKKIDTFISSIQTFLYLMKNRSKYDHIFWFNNANFPGIVFSLFLGVPMSVNTDGLEWRRAKWKWPFKLYYFLSSYIISKVCKSVISDSIGIQNYYKKKFRKNTKFIPYGVIIPEKGINGLTEQNVLNKLNLISGKYFLQITRFEPENYPLETIKSFINSGLAKEGYKMVVVGYKEGTKYAENVKGYDKYSEVDVHPGIYDKDVLQIIRKNAYCYVHGNSVGGTNPALLEAMASCKRVMAIDIEFSKEVLGDTGIYYNLHNFKDVFRNSIKIRGNSEELLARVIDNYNWNNVSEQYISLVERKKIIASDIEIQYRV